MTWRPPRVSTSAARTLLLLPHRTAPTAAVRGNTGVLLYLNMMFSHRVSPEVHTADFYLALTHLQIATRRVCRRPQLTGVLFCSAGSQDGRESLVDKWCVYYWTLVNAQYTLGKLITTCGGFLFSLALQLASSSLNISFILCVTFSCNVVLTCATVLTSYFTRV